MCSSATSGSKQTRRRRHADWMPFVQVEGDGDFGVRRSVAISLGNVVAGGVRLCGEMGSLESERLTSGWVVSPETATEY